jgi:ureidoglycolate dehydrogenase (NAD+)
VLLRAEDGRALAFRVLADAGMGDEDAEACADLLVESSLRGVDSHGLVALLGLYAEQATKGVGRPGVTPSVRADTGSVAVVEGGDASGPRTARLALATAIERAHEHGVGAVVAREIGYFGALWWSVFPAASQGLIAISTVNAAAFVTPHGGIEALHGTNPIAVAIPLEPDPFVLDMRTNTFRMADFYASLQTGAPLPADALRRADGAPVKDAAELEASLWTSAVSFPVAGEKGYGLALVVDFLTAALAGTPIGREVSLEQEDRSLAAFFLVLDPAAFGPQERFADAARRLADQVHATTPLHAEVPVRLPGERGAAERRRRIAEGIPVDPVLWRRLEEKLASLGLAAGLLPDSIAG